MRTWYKTGKAEAFDGKPVSNFLGGQKLDPDEEIWATAVIASGKVYTGSLHGEAMYKAIEDQAAEKNAEGHFVSTDGSEVFIDAFVTSKGRLIDRFTSSLERDISSGEHLHP